MATGKYSIAGTGSDPVLGRVRSPSHCPGFASHGEAAPLAFKLLREHMTAVSLRFPTFSQ